jgi:hypothetical protein
MTPTYSSPSVSSPSSTLRQNGLPTRRRRSRPRREPTASHQPLLGGYSDRHGHAREVIAQAGAAGSTLVIDRDSASHGDARLVAHLGADEPSGNAALICDSYLRDAADGANRCRRLTAADARVVPFPDQTEAGLAAPAASAELQPVDRRGRSYALEPVHSGMSIPELRWCRVQADRAVEHEPVSLREAIAALERYEPLLALTMRALALHRHDGNLSTTLLRAELSRVQLSPIVLNRRLREVVLAAVARQELSMSEIALRCGRVKRDRNGNESGETSWLARRVGLLPEGGRSTPTPWIHSDVLGLIARDGLGITPREVEPR